MLIGNRMTVNPVTATPDMSIKIAADIMKKEKVHRLPVLDENKKLVGVISEKDILLAAPSPASTLSTYEMNFLLEKLTVKKIMTQTPVTITKNTTVEEAARLMVDQDLSCLPVLEGTTLVGIVSKSDLFKMLLELFGARFFGVRVEFLVEDKPGTIAKISNALAEKGIEIVSLGTFMGNDSVSATITMKLRGADQNAVLSVIEPFAIEVVDVREV